MAYLKTAWKDKVIEKPRTFTLQNNPDGTVTLIPVEGTVYEPGTSVTAANLNKIEQGIADANDPVTLLAYIKTVDGAGSGLDTDLFRGINLLQQNQSTHANAVGLSEALKWKNFGNGHTIFDASASTAPDGTAVNSTNAANPWITTFPSLMGWNGSATYGLRVDSARNADYAGGVAFRFNNGTVEYYHATLGWIGVGGLKNVQRGQTVMTAGTVNVTISAVGMAKSFVVADSTSGISTGTPEGYKAIGRLTSATNLELYRPMNDNFSTTVNWEVVESY